MVQAQYFTPGLYSPEQAPQPVYDMPANFNPMAPQPQPMIAVSRPQVHAYRVVLVPILLPNLPRTGL